MNDAADTAAPDVLEVLRRHARGVEAFLRETLPVVTSLGQAPAMVVEAMNYSLLAGGKRIRPALAIECCACCGGDVESVRPAAVAVELIHTFSLIHDDLPAMDDDDLRRGRPTNHKVFGEAMAILAGDAMTALAFELLAASYEPDIAQRLILELAKATGAAGMVGGQALDIAAENTSVSLEDLQNIHRRKTGALVVASCRMGGIVARADPAALDALTRYGEHLGLAFQIADDLLDITATPEELGKATQKDERAGKNTYPALLGVEASRLLAQTEVEKALAALKRFDDKGTVLRAMARFSIARQN